jgi:NAD(P)-dependent dehydrogenase (short-subunit alcohol dehydrogenase family)
MGVFAITGASGGIGGKTAELLKEKGHEVINIDVKNGDINVNLASEEGRQEAVDKLHEMCPDGLDGLLCIAGVSASCGNLKLIVSLNYFGAIALAEGTFDLLRKKGGSCVLAASNTISQGAARMDIVDLLNNYGDEERLLKLVDTLDVRQNAHPMYVASKYALSRWMRRVSSAWAAEGVRINAIAPGNVATPMTDVLQGPAWEACLALPIPTYYGQDCLMQSSDIAKAFAFMASPDACGINGVILFVDGGTDALLNTEKVY